MNIHRMPPPFFPQIPHFSVIPPPPAPKQATPPYHLFFWFFFPFLLPTRLSPRTRVSFTRGGSPRGTFPRASGWAWPLTRGGGGGGRRRRRHTDTGPTLPPRRVGAPRVEGGVRVCVWGGVMNEAPPPLPAPLSLPGACAEAGAGMGPAAEQRRRAATPGLPTPPVPVPVLPSSFSSPGLHPGR